MLSDKLIKQSGLDWNLDPAASGMRSRAFAKGGFEILVYEYGYWQIRTATSLMSGAAGEEATPELAAKRALLVLHAMQMAI